MAKNGDELDKLKQVLDYNWPEIQKHLIEEAAKEATEKDGVERDPYEPYWTENEDGTRTLHGSVDSWWLKDFKREDVILSLPRIAIMNTKPWHLDSVCLSLRKAYGVRDSYIMDEQDDIFSESDIQAHIDRFPEGQFAAQLIAGPNAGNCAGMAVTMRASRPPTAPILTWREAIGDMRLAAHEPAGEWLYGVEMAVHPVYQRSGIGTGLYDARMQLVGSLNLRGWYFVGMLMGYQRHAGDMDAREYGRRVIAGEIKDPTVTMQMNRGFRPVRVIEGYVEEEAAGDAGVLLVWENPEYDAGRAT